MDLMGPSRSGGWGSVRSVRRRGPSTCDFIIYLRDVVVAFPRRLGGSYDRLLLNVFSDHQVRATAPYERGLCLPRRQRPHRQKFLVIQAARRRR